MSVSKSKVHGNKHNHEDLNPYNYFGQPRQLDFNLSFFSDDYDPFLRFPFKC